MNLNTQLDQLKVAEVLDATLVSLRSSNYGDQVWFLCTLRGHRRSARPHQCAVCKQVLAKGSRAWRPITNAGNRMERICPDCMGEAIRDHKNASQEEDVHTSPSPAPAGSRICPRCEESVMPAELALASLSRHCAVHICNDCGQAEAFMDILTDADTLADAILDSEMAVWISIQTARTATLREYCREHGIEWTGES